MHPLFYFHSFIFIYKLSFLKNRKISFLPANIWLLFSTFLLCIPGTNLPSKFSIEWLNDIWFDKWIHTLLFTILVFLFCWADFRSKKPIAFYWFAILGVVYGISLEMVQHFFIPQRSFELGDIVADVIGCLLAVVIAKQKFTK